MFHPVGAEAEEEDDQVEESEEEQAAAPTLTGIYRASGTNPSGSKYTGMVAIEEADDDFKLTWWIGEDVFTGSGHFAGKMLVINWGDKTPVIYSFDDDGALDEGWADGSASETLTPVGKSGCCRQRASAARRQVSRRGAHPEGKDYNDQNAKGYRLSWQVGDSAYEGDGTLAGNLLTVNWGGATPIVYALDDDGNLTGLLDGGHGEETLTPRAVSGVPPPRNSDRA